MVAHIHRDLRPLVRAARAGGWTVDYTNRGHLRLTSPTGAVVVTGGTPSDHTAHRGIFASDSVRKDSHADPDL